jgi:cold shock CspA family protein
MVETGKVKFFLNDHRDWGIIQRDGTEKGLFFHISQVLAADDGIQYPPVKDCIVEFETALDERSGRIHATNVAVMEWPRWMYEDQAPADPIAEHFLTAEELPQIEFPEVNLSGSVLLRPENRNRTLFEIMQNQK